MALHGHKLPADIETAMIADYIAARPDWSEATKSLIRDCFHAFLAFCGCKPNPADELPNWSDVPRHVAVPKEGCVMRAFETAVQMCESESAADIRDGLVFVLAVYSGCRRGEFRDLTINELFEALEYPESDGTFRMFTSGKTGEAIMRFSRYHLPYIERYLGFRPDGSDSLFVNLDSRSSQYGQGLSLVTFNRMRWKVCKRADVPVVTYQDLRKRLATMVARTNGVDVAAHALNHSPHSGDRVIRLFYYDPDKAAVDRACQDAFEAMK